MEAEAKLNKSNDRYQCASLPSSSSPLAISASEAPKCKKSVHWSGNVVSGVRTITRLTKEQLCGTIGVDNWMFFAKTGIAAERDKWAQRTLTVGDLDSIRKLPCLASLIC